MDSAWHPVHSMRWCRGQIRWKRSGWMDNLRENPMDIYVHDPIQVRNVEATNRMVIELIGWNIGLYIYMFFLLFFKHFVTIQIPGGPVNFPFPGTIPSSPKTSCWKHARDECHPDPLSAEAANLPRWKVVDGQYVPLKWGSPRSYSPRWSHRSHNYHIFFQIFEGLNGTYIFIGGFINGESPI